LLSAVAEKNPALALSVNMTGFQNVLELAKIHRLRLYSPSTIGAFGPSTPKVDTPDLTIMRPNTIYGITKLHMELLGEVTSRSQHATKYAVNMSTPRMLTVFQTLCDIITYSTTAKSLVSISDQLVTLAFSALTHLQVAVRPTMPSTSFTMPSATVTTTASYRRIPVCQ
jgi:dTDP-4-dehydrorhamnose reductase